MLLKTLIILSFIHNIWTSSTPHKLLKWFHPKKPKSKSKLSDFVVDFNIIKGSTISSLEKHDVSSFQNIFKSEIPLNKLNGNSKTDIFNKEIKFESNKKFSTTTKLSTFESFKEESEESTKSSSEPIETMDMNWESLDEKDNLTIPDEKSQIKMSPSMFDYNGKRVFNAVQLIRHRLFKVHTDRKQLEKIAEDTHKGFKELASIEKECSDKYEKLISKKRNDLRKLENLLKLAKEKEQLDDTVSILLHKVISK